MHYGCCVLEDARPKTPLLLRTVFAVDFPARRLYNTIKSPVLSTCPLHTKSSGCGKERRISIGPW